jgi:hypothetical protein
MGSKGKCLLANFNKGNGTALNFPKKARMKQELWPIWRKNAPDQHSAIE